MTKLEPIHINIVGGFQVILDPSLHNGTLELRDAEGNFLAGFYNGQAQSVSIGMNGEPSCSPTSS